MSLGPGPDMSGNNGVSSCPAACYDFCDPKYFPACSNDCYEQAKCCGGGEGGDNGGGTCSGGGCDACGGGSGSDFPGGIKHYTAFTKSASSSGGKDICPPRTGLPDVSPWKQFN